MYVIMGIVAVIAIYIISQINRVLYLRKRAERSFSVIDIYLKKRYDLIPNLVETVKGYASHEKETLEAAINARNKATTTNSVEDTSMANNELMGALNKLFALAEAYPDLKANTNFLDLQANLKETEDKISYARQFYNDSVLKYNNKVEMIPTNIVAMLFGFKKYEFFEISEEERQVTQIKF